MTENQKPNPVVTELMQRALGGAIPLKTVYPPEVIASATAMLPEVELELKKFLEEKKNFLSFDRPLEERCALLLAEARKKMPSDVSFLTIKPYDLQFHEHPNNIESQEIASLLSGLGEVMGQLFNNVLSRRVAASMALTKWIQSIDPKCRIEISTNDDEVRKWWDRTILYMIIER